MTHAMTHAMTPEEIASELARTAARLRAVSYGCNFNDCRQAAASIALTIAADAVNAAAFRFDPAAAERASDERAANRAPIQYIRRPDVEPCPGTPAY